MTKITVICALLLLLLSCGHKGGIDSGDSSPIIISDGSTHVKHGKLNQDFSVKQPTHAEIQIATYAPTAVGFLCDPSAYPSTYPPFANLCTSAPLCVAGTTPTVACKVALSGVKSWDLLLCEHTASCNGSGDIRVKWVDSSNDKMTIDSFKNPFRYIPASPTVGGELVHAGADTLQSATLVTRQTGGPNTYPFVCSTTGQACLVIAYDRP
jgi:hypothetical protein